MQTLRGKSIIQFICMIAVAVTATFHVDARFASTGLDRVVSFSVQDDEQGSEAKVVSDLCTFCSGTAAVTEFAPLSSAPSIHRSVPSTRTRDLVAFKLATSAPPPKS